MRVTDATTGKTYFSKKRKRIDQVRSARSLTFSCFNGYPFLAKDRTRRWFVKALQEGRRKFPVDLWAWVIMPEHVHLLVYPRADGKAVGKFQGFVKE